MTKTNLFCIVAIVVFAFFFVRRCKSDFWEDTIEQSPPSEQARTAVINLDSIKHAAYQEADAKWQARHKADSTALAASIPLRKAASEKARHSALKYAETNKPEDCNTALIDCQEENETKAYSLAVSERMIAGFESSDSLHRVEIERQVAVIDTLGAGWAKANVVNGKLEKKIERKNTLLKIGGAVIAVLGILVAAR